MHLHTHNNVSQMYQYYCCIINKSIDNKSIDNNGIKFY